MNYDSAPDVPPDGMTSVDCVLLFQRFRQDADIALLEQQLESAVNAHLATCRLAVLIAAARQFYWCEYPEHPVESVNTRTRERLVQIGFRLELHTEADERTAPSRLDRTKTMTVPVIRSYTTIGWLVPSAQAATQAEWKRREEMEDKQRKLNPPSRLSQGEGETLEYGNAIWAATHDSGRWIVEVQRINQRCFLCVFDRATADACVFVEGTSVAFGAPFGPDSFDIDGWMERADEIIGTLTRH